MLSFQLLGLYASCDVNVASASGAGRLAPSTGKGLRRVGRPCQYYASVTPGQRRGDVH